MKKFWIQVIVLLAVFTGSLYISFNPEVLNVFSGSPISFGSQNVQNTTSQIMIKNVVLNIEVADSAEERKTGLGGRESLGGNEGMLFLFPEEKKYRFWMKGMKFSLDFIFLRQGKVVDILRKVPPPEQGQKDETLPIYEPVTTIDMLLEVNAGFVDATGVKVGDTISLIN